MAAFRGRGIEEPTLRVVFCIVLRTISQHSCSGKKPQPWSAAAASKRWRFFGSFLTPKRNNTPADCRFPAFFRLLKQKKQNQGAPSKARERPGLFLWLESAPHPEPALGFVHGNGAAGHVFDHDPLAGGGNGGHQLVQHGGVALGFQLHAAVPVVHHPAGQPQQRGRILGPVPEPHALHAAGEPPVAALRGAHSSIPVTV